MRGFVALFALVAALAAADVIDDVMMASVDGERIREDLFNLTRTPHVFGRPRSKIQASLIAQQWTATGFFDEVHIEKFSGNVVFYPQLQEIMMLSPEQHNLTVVEPPSPVGDQLTDVLPLFNAYSASGDVTARVIYVNYCRKRDYEYLKDVLRVDLSGAPFISLCRYGKVMRGLKGAYSQDAGALATLIFSDPQDDGYTAGVQWPEGPARNSVGGQRGSANFLPWCPGNPSAARIAGICNLTHQPRSTVLPEIPIQPLAWGEARLLLERLMGTPVRTADGWQGALDFHYRIGDGATPVVVRVNVQMERQLVDGYNVVATRWGSASEEQTIMVGSHHDAWVAGAQDPTGGIIVMTEAARLLKAGLDSGAQFSRTIQFNAWDGEEWALIGSTDYVETNAARLSANASYYLNFDDVTKAAFADRSMLTVEASPVLAAVLRSNAAKVKFPFLENTTLADRMPEMGILGSGSDYVAFVDRLGVSSAGFTWQNEVDPSQYHSRYDNFYLVDQFLDPTMELHECTASYVAVLLRDLSSSQVIAADVHNVAEAMSRYRGIIEGQFPDFKLDWDAYKGQQLQLKLSADSITSSTSSPEINRALMTIEREAFLDRAGLPGRPYYRNLLYAASLLDGYAAQALPGVAYFARQQDLPGAQRELDRVVLAMQRAVAHLESGIPAHLSSDELAALIAGAILVTIVIVAVTACLCARRKKAASSYQPIV